MDRQAYLGSRRRGKNLRPEIYYPAATINETDMHETIICAAVRFKGKVWMGHRHCHAIEAMTDELSWVMSRMHMHHARTNDDQGFVTSLNRYVGREEALAIQKAAGIPCFRGEYGSELYSEDLY